MLLHRSSKKNATAQEIGEHDGIEHQALSYIVGYASDVALKVVWVGGTQK